MQLCSRSVRTLGEQALGVKKGLFVNGRRCGDKEDGLQIYMPAASLSSHPAVGLGLSGATEVRIGARAQTLRRLADERAGLSIVVVIRGCSLSLSTPC